MTIKIPIKIMYKNIWSKIENYAFCHEWFKWTVFSFLRGLGYLVVIGSIFLGAIFLVFWGIHIFGPWPVVLFGVCLFVGVLIQLIEEDR